MQTTYDEIQYQDEAIKATSISHIHGVATLFGLKPQDPNRARVLELGCARALNLINLAYLHPKSKFVGVDLSKAQIEVANERITGLALGNIEAKHASILDIDQSWGTFDYIIAHGILSWVPDDVRQKIFSIFETNLSPQGIGYVSYNTYPGWHIRDPLRAYMLEAAKDHTEFNTRATAGREILAFLLRCMEAEETPISKCYQQEIKQMISMPNWYYIHDFMNDICQPFYFVNVIKDLKAHNLEYLGDSEIASMLPGNLSPKIQQALRQKAIDEIKVEHLMDFCSNRMFRRTLVVKKGTAISRKVFPSQLHNAYLSSPMFPSTETEEESKVRFVHPNGGGLESSDPLLRQIVLQLHARWPDNMNLLDLYAYVNLSPESPKALEIAEQLLRCAFANLVDISYFPYRCTPKIEEKPIASKVARYIAKQSTTIPTLRHDTAHLDAIEQQIISHLDGTHAKDELPKLLDQNVPEIVKSSAFSDDKGVDRFLEQFAKRGLLEK